MITELRAEYFKSWVDTGALRLAPLTGFFGANSSGKTSILQVLLMLKQTVEHPPEWNEPLYFGDENSLVNLRSFDDVIHRPAYNPILGISVSWNLPKKRYIQNLGDISAFSLSVRIFGGALLSFSHTVDGNFSVDTRSTDGKYQISSQIFHGWAQSLFRCYGIRDFLTDSPSADFTRLQQILADLEDAFEKLFDQFYYLGPLRGSPSPHYIWGGKHPDDVGKYGEDMVSALFSSRIQSGNLDEHVPKWLQRLGLIHSYRLAPVPRTQKNYEFLVTIHKGGPEVRLTDVGFGVSQVLPVLILCYYAPEGSILILEQPEAHLHPKVQSELGDVLIDVVKNRDLQIILESHSEHLLHRLMRRTAEEQLCVDDTALYFCQINEGASEVEQLKVDEYGNISNWPQEFFGDITGELIKQAEAEIEHRETHKS